MTNLEIYQSLKLKLDTAEMMLRSMQFMIDSQTSLVERLDSEVSTLKSELTDDELLEIEVF